MDIHSQRVILTDVDNTLFSWIDYFAPCFRALVHAVSREGGIEEDDLYASFQIVFQREGSVEFRRAIQENRLIQGLSQEKQDELVHVGAIAFGQATRRHLRPYPSVVSTLRRLRQDGIRIVAVTNSGGLQATNRLRRLGLAKLLDGLVASNHDSTGATASGTEYAEAVAASVRRSGLPWVVTLPEERLKPNPVAYEIALDRLGVKDCTTWIIGDSLSKDLAAAPAIKASSVWARYGHAFEQRNFDTLVRITHWSPERIRSTYDTSVLAPDHVADDFSDLLDIITVWQRELF